MTCGDDGNEPDVGGLRHWAAVLGLLAFSVGLATDSWGLVASLEGQRERLGRHLRVRDRSVSPLRTHPTARPLCPSGQSSHWRDGHH